MENGELCGVMMLSIKNYTAKIQKIRKKTIKSKILTNS